MTRLLLIPIIGMLTACATVTVPVTQPFPKAPDVLLAQCPSLKLISADETRLTALLAVVVENYASFYECSEIVANWQEWYTQQRTIFNAIGTGSPNGK